MRLYGIYIADNLTKPEGNSKKPLKLCLSELQKNLSPSEPQPLRTFKKPFVPLPLCHFEPPEKTSEP